MAIIGEDGTGIAGAEAYGADPVALIDAYWAARPNDPMADDWAALLNITAKKEGAARMATAYLDATYGAFYIGVRKTQGQGLLWPRVVGRDDDGNLVPLADGLGNDLPALPPQLISAMAELAGRAMAGPLAQDVNLGERIKSETVGPISTTYVDSVSFETSYGAVAGILAPILNGSQPGAQNATWFWR